MKSPEPDKSKSKKIKVQDEDPEDLILGTKRLLRQPDFGDFVSEPPEVENDSGPEEDPKVKKVQEFLKTCLAAGLKKNSILKVYTAALLLLDKTEDDFMSRRTISRRIDAMFKDKYQQHREESSGITTFSYDGRKDLTLQPKGKLHRESHISFVGDDGEYLNHCTMEFEDGEEAADNALNIAAQCNDVLLEYNSEESVTFISSDGTNTNTGWKGTFIS